MTQFFVGDRVRVVLPRGKNKRGVPGIHMMFSSWPQARFDGAVGVIEDINPRAQYEIPMYLINFRGQPNRMALPWMAEWFREAWLELVERSELKPPTTGNQAEAGAVAAAGGQPSEPARG